MFNIRYVLFAGVALIAAFAAYFLLEREKASVAVATISITDKAFVPEGITVQKGTKLIFKNDGKAPHWPASNFHPTHTLYPDDGGCLGSTLDACRGLEHGEPFEYVVWNIGEWPLHDHLFPGLMMVVKVVETIEDLPQDANKEIPLASELLKLNYAAQFSAIKSVIKEDPVKAWDYLKKAFIVNGQVMGNAHEFAHIVGNAIYSEYGLRGIKNCDPEFAYGCFHGVTEKLLQDKGIGVIKDVQKTCLKVFPPEKTQDYTGCIHGMGHGLLAFENFNIRAALKDCDILEYKYKNYCYDGVFMENAAEAKQEFDPQQPWDTCTKLPEQYRYNCARYQTLFFIDEYKRDTRLVTANCAKAPNDILRTTCFESLGYHVAEHALGNFDKIKSECAKSSTSEGDNTCVIGAARETIFQRYSEWKEISDKLCLSLNDTWVQNCLDSNKAVRRNYNL